MKIYTRTGDDGDTALFGGGRVGKDHPRVVAYGDVDELNAVLGWIVVMPPKGFWRDLLLAVQRDLFAIGGQLASPDPARVAAALEKAVLDESRVEELEAAIDEAEAELVPLTAFILPGGTAKAAVLHLARTVCRRAERGVVALAHAESVPPVILQYLNRLSDLLFVLARLANHRARMPEDTW